MRFQRAGSALAVIVTLAFVSAAPVHASPKSKHVGARPVHGAHRAHAPYRPHVGSTSVGLAGARHAPGRMRARLTTLGQSPGFVTLVGDPESGLGFYPLPWRYRIGAWRWRQRRAIESAEAIRAAVASTAVYSYGWFPFYGYGYGYGGRPRGVLNPVDGYGTPFFAGYYGGGPYGD